MIGKIHKQEDCVDYDILCDILMDIINDIGDDEYEEDECGIS